jgi:hypothetical protein
MPHPWRNAPPSSATGIGANHSGAQLIVDAGSREA